MPVLRGDFAFLLIGVSDARERYGRSGGRWKKFVSRHPLACTRGIDMFSTTATWRVDEKVVAVA